MLGVRFRICSVILKTVSSRMPCSCDCSHTCLGYTASQPWRSLWVPNLQPFVLVHLRKEVTFFRSVLCPLAVVRKTFPRMPGSVRKGKPEWKREC